MSSKAHHHGNALNRKVAAPKRANPTRATKYPSPSTWSRNIPTEKEIESPTSKSETPRKDARKPTDPNRP